MTVRIIPYRPRHARRRVSWRWLVALAALAAGCLIGAAGASALLAANPGGVIR